MYFLNKASLYSTLLPLAALTATTSATPDDTLDSLQKRDVACPNVLGIICLIIPDDSTTTCDSTCRTIRAVESCTTATCVCSAANVQAYASCLQCAAINDVEYSSLTSLQSFSDSFVSNCRAKGFNLQSPRIGSSGTKAPTPTATHFRSGGDDDDPFSDGIDTGLATGIIIAIVVGVPVGTLLVFGLIGWIFASHVLSRRRKMVQGYYNFGGNNGY